MTLAELINKAREVGDKFNSYWIPLYDKNHIEIKNIEFEIQKDVKDGWFIQINGTDPKLTWKDICCICEVAAGMLGKNINDELMGRYDSPKEFYEKVLEKL